MKMLQCLSVFQLPADEDVKVQDVSSENSRPCDRTRLDVSQYNSLQH